MSGSLFNNLLGSGGVGSLGPNTTSDFGSLSVSDLMGSSGLPSYNASGTINGIDFNKLGGASSGSGLGLNLGTGQLALGSIGALGNLWTAFQAQDLAKKQFNFTKDVVNTNLANQLQTYNTSLSDRINARAKTQGMSQTEVNDYLSKNSLTRR